MLADTTIAGFRKGDVPHLTSSNLTSRTEQPQPYDINRFVQFHQFENAKILAFDEIQGVHEISAEVMYKEYVQKSLLLLMKALRTAIIIMEEQKNKPAPDHPSFLRYFRRTQQDASVVHSMLIAVSTAIGDPAWEFLRQQSGCNNNPKIDLIYQDFAGEHQTCIPWQPAENYPPGALVYTSHVYYPQTPAAQAKYPAGLVLCQQWFYYWRDGDTAGINDKDISTWLEYGYQHQTEEFTYTNWGNLLHELLHLNTIYPSQWQWKVPGNPWEAIQDLVYQQEDGTIIQAYGARAANCINRPLIYNIYDLKDYPDYKQSLQEQKVDPEWYAPTKNPDNYVSLVKELYYREKLNLPPWEDSPPRYNSPHLPDAIKAMFPKPPSAIPGDASEAGPLQFIPYDDGD